MTIIHSRTAVCGEEGAHLWGSMVKVVAKQAVLLILLLHLMQQPCAGFYEKGSNVFLIKDQKQMQEQVEMFVRLRHSLPALIKV